MTHETDDVEGVKAMFYYTEEDWNYQTQSWKDKGPSELSRFDRELRKQWDQALSTGVMRYGVDHLVTKVVDGPKHYVVTLNTKRNSKRRRPQEITSMQQPFNDKSFNFTQAKPEEILLMMKKCPSSSSAPSGGRSHENGSRCEPCNNAQQHKPEDCHLSDCRVCCAENGFREKHGMDSYPENKGVHTLIANVSPMEYGHTVLAPERNACHNQIMTKTAITAAIELLLLSKHRGLIMGFNSLCANASVNHLHLNFFYLEYELISNHCPVRHLAGHVYETTTLPCNGFVLQMHESSVETMARLVFKICRCLLDNEVPHNLFLCRGVAFGEDRYSDKTTLRLFIFPRKKYFIGSEESVIFFVACYEFGGYLPVFEPEIFNELTEAQADATLAALKFPDDEYAKIKETVTQMLTVENEV